MTLATLTLAGALAFAQDAPVSGAYTEGVAVAELEPRPMKPAYISGAVTCVGMGVGCFLPPVVGVPLIVGAGAVMPIFYATQPRDIPVDLLDQHPEFLLGYEETMQRRRTRMAIAGSAVACGTGAVAAVGATVLVVGVVLAAL